MKPLEIGIAGCGPAGLAAGLALSRAGHNVVLFDQFDTPKPLGSGLILQPPGLAVLDWLGLGERMRGLGARIDRLYGRSSTSQSVVLDVRYASLAGGETGVAVHRAALFNVLFDAARAAGLAFETGHRIIAMERDAARRPRLKFEDGRLVPAFDLVIDALGSRSPLMDDASAPVRRSRLDYGALWTSLPWPGAPFDIRALEQRYEWASVMIGVLPIGKTIETDQDQAAFFWSIKTGDHDAWKAAGLEKWKSRVLELWPQTEPLLERIVDAEQMTLAGYGHHTLPLPFGERIAFIGDCAHSTSPQLGQGANMALLDVHALAHALERNSDLAGALADYARVRRWHVRLYQALSCVFTPFYQSDSTILPLMRDRLVGPLSGLPGARQLLAMIVSGRLGLLRLA